MSNTINADNGVVSGVAGLKYSADTSGQLILQTNTTNALTLDTNQNATFATGILATNPFTGTYTDGTIVDYITGVGRINVGPSDDIAFYHNGIGSRTEIARFTYTGRLGVGTASPATTIDAYGVIRASTGSTLYTSITSPAVGGVSGKITSSDNNLELIANSGSGASVNMQFKVTASGVTAEAMRITSAGDVGIGTSSPAYKLDIQTAGTGVTARASAGNAYLRLEPVYGVGASYIDFGASGSTAQDARILSGSGSVSNLIFLTGGASLAERMRIDSSGNVGINTNSPGFTLQVNATNEWPITSRSASNTTTFRGTFLNQKALGSLASPLAVTAGTILGGIEAGGYNGSAYTLGYNGGSAIMTYAEATWTGTSNPTYITFSTNASGVAGYAERMRITSAGKVGISVTSPNFNLSLNNGLNDFVLGLYDSSNYPYGFGIRSGQLMMYAASDGVISFGNMGTVASSTFTERMKINTSGYVTKPYQPAFMATTNTTTTGAVVKFSNVVTNVGSGYSSSTGQFTAPVAGTYLIFAQLMGVNGSGRIIWYIQKNGSTITQGGGASTDYQISSSTAVIVMAAGDTAQVYLLSGSAYPSSQEAVFGGYLLG
jgi:hypothetical protein